MNPYAASIIEAIPTVEVYFPYLGVVDLTPYLVALGVFVALTLVFKLIQILILERLRSWSTKTKVVVDDVVINAITGIRWWVYTIVALYAALSLLALPSGFMFALKAGTYLALAWQAIEVILCFIDFAAKHYLEKDEDGDGLPDPNAATASHLVTLIARIALWSLGGLFVLSNLGIEVTSLIAGLGIGGIAVAFALQGILSDLFASFSLYFDKPFRVGDFIEIGPDSGTVEKIGIKTTRIRTLQGEELVVSNAELTTARVQNYKRMNERRIRFTFGILYETPYEKVMKVNDIVRDIFPTVPGTRLDRVHFTTLGDSALLFEVVYYVDSAEYVQYLNAQESINLALLKQLAAAGIGFAYPTQTVYVKQ